MEVDKVRELRDKLSKDIEVLLERFQNETGTTPFVDVQWYSHEEVGTRRRVFTSPSVEIELKL